MSYLLLYTNGKKTESYNMKSKKINRFEPTDTISIYKQFYDGDKKKHIKYKRNVNPIKSQIRKTSIKKLHQIKDKEKNDRYNDFINRNVIYETEIIKHHRRKQNDKELIEIDVYTDHTNHKMVRITELYYDFSRYEYLPRKSVSLPIKDFKIMTKTLSKISF